MYILMTRYFVLTQVERFGGVCPESLQSSQIIQNSKLKIYEAFNICYNAHSPIVARSFAFNL